MCTIFPEGTFVAACPSKGTGGGTGVFIWTGNVGGTGVFIWAGKVAEDGGAASPHFEVSPFRINPKRSRYSAVAFGDRSLSS